MGKFAPLHRGHQRLLDHAAAIASELTVIVWSTPDFADMPNSTRAAWVRELYPKAIVLVADDGPANDADDAVHHRFVAQVLAQNRLDPDVVLSGEPYGPSFAKHLGAEHVAVDRSNTPIWNGSAVRADVHANRSLMDPRVYRHFVDKVVFLGAESTGKSTLAARMAQEFDTVYVPEYGREHYEERNGHLDLADFLTIAQVHRDREDALALEANRFLFSDTNAVTTMFFSHYYNRDSLLELRRLADDCRSRYRYVIVCGDDIPFEQDGWRDNDVWRARMQGMVLHDLAVRGTAHSTVNGSLEERALQVKEILRGHPVVQKHGDRSFGPRPQQGR